jgi:zinc transporter 2
VSVVLVFFITAQFMGGYIANSMALLAGPALMGSELLGFGMSISALSSSAASAQKGGLTFGWHRAEVVGTLL